MLDHNSGLIIFITNPHRRRFPLRLAAAPLRIMKVPPMHKLKLDLDALTVDTFSTGNDIDGKGTVQGNYAEQPTTSLNDQLTCGQQSCQGPTCYTCSICMSFDQRCQEEELEPAY